MTVVTPFVPRIGASGWTEAERDRLADLADRLAARFGQVHATYGTSDKGEPWCAITDDDDEVIVHVARIDGQFVIHQTGEDVLRVGDTLWSACDRLMGEDWREGREDVVVSLNRRQAQSVLALAVLADFVYEIGEAKAAPSTEPVTFKAEGVASAVLTLTLAAPAASAAPEEQIAPAKDDAETHELAPGATADAPQAAPRLDDDRLAPIDDQALGDEGPAPPPTPMLDRPTASLEARVQVGGDGDDFLRGGDGQDILIGGAGDDTAFGGGADDRLIGGQDNDVLLGQDGNDAAYGNGGNDTVDGGHGDDWVRGGQGDDSVAGGAGGDVVSGDKGADTVSGGGGADTFLFFSGGGLDQVTDFDPGQGDKVVIEDRTTFQVTQQGGDTVIELGATDRVVLLNVQLTSLPSDWLVC